MNQFPVDNAWKPLDDRKDYTLVLPDFILAGGDGYGMVPTGMRYPSPPVTRVLVGLPHVVRLQEHRTGLAPSRWIPQQPADGK